MTAQDGDAAISRLDAFGVEEGYEDASGKWRQPPPETYPSLTQWAIRMRNHPCW